VAVIAGAAAIVRVVVVAARTGVAAFRRIACAVGAAARAVGCFVDNRPTSSAEATPLSGVAAC
jgi:hypothetical protein